MKSKIVVNLYEQEKLQIRYLGYLAFWLKMHKIMKIYVFQRFKYDCMNENWYLYAFKFILNYLFRH